MAQPLKRLYTPAYVKRLAGNIAAVEPDFAAAQFVSAVLGRGWKSLELKQRVRRISTSLGEHLPGEYPAQLATLTRIAPDHAGLLGLFLPDFVEVHGQDDVVGSIPALQYFTQFSSSEFAVRPFIVRYEDHMMQVMRAWASLGNEHVRRLASEGCRPRLPWGRALERFIEDPTPILPILERLRADPSEYVRRSVANNLNDIGKDHPDLVLDTARRWLGESEATDQLVKHGCRTLLKRGDQRALKLFGQHDAVPVKAQLTLAAKTVSIGKSLGFAVVLRSAAATHARIEYAIDFVKKSGATSRKVFKIGDRKLVPKAPLRIERRHRFTDFTTRKHYPGAHRIAVLVNGVERARKKVAVTASE
jgi:3-methyladenine DNA glycosylase AlkC